MRTASSPLGSAHQRSYPWCCIPVINLSFPWCPDELRRQQPDSSHLRTALSWALQSSRCFEVANQSLAALDPPSYLWVGLVFELSTGVRVEKSLPGLIMHSGVRLASRYSVAGFFWHSYSLQALWEPLQIHLVYLQSPCLLFQPWSPASVAQALYPSNARWLS